MTRAAGDLVSDYMKRLETELADLPRARRREILDEIAEHIADAHAESEVDVRNLLDRLGDPAEIGDEARDRLGRRQPKAGATEIVALILLPIGGVVVPFIGWVVGVVFLWGSPLWTAREKLLGTFIVPGGLLFPFLLLSGVIGAKTCFGDGDRETCTGGLGLPDVVLSVGFMLAVIGPIAMAAYLARQMRRRSA